MTTHLFGVLPLGADLSPPLGVRAIATPAGVAWVHDAGNAHDAPAHDARQIALQTALVAGVTPAPARAGATFASDAALVEALERDAEHWAAALAHVSNAVEMLVFVPLDHEAPRPSPNASPGRAYLEGRRRGDTSVSRALRDALGACVRDERIVTHASGSATLVSHLVARHDVAEYHERVTRWRGERAVRVLGPLPPFSFAEVRA